MRILHRIGAGMGIKGDLKTVSLSGVLQLLCNDNVSGFLSITNAESEYQIIFVEGSIVYAIESLKEARLGTLLVNDGVLNQEQLKKSLETAKEKKEGLGKVLVDKKLITEAVLERYLYRQVEEILFALFRWRDGMFEFKDSRLNLKWMVVIRLNTMKVILDASRRLDMMKIYTGKITSDKIMFSPPEMPWEDNDNLNESEKRILGMLDGKLNVRQLIQKGDLDEFTVYETLYEIIGKKLIHI